MRKPSSTSFPSASGVTVLRGRADILSHRDLLEELALRFEQATAMHGLAYFLNRPENLKKVPYLVLVSYPPQQQEAIASDQLLGAVLLYEYSVLGFGTGIFTAADACGHRSVIAPRHLREYVTSIACSEMLHRRAHFVYCSFQQELSAETADTYTPPIFGELAGSWAATTRTIPDHLPLQSTYDATLAALGKRTRHNLRLFRRRVETDFQATYLPDACSEVRREDLSALNAGSLNPIDQQAFDLQWDSCTRLNGGFVSGLRAADGRWLSLIGGWRQHGTTVVQWQMNTAGHEKSSLSVAARSFLLEHEVALGQTELRFEGGTPHSLTNSFTEVSVVDLLVRRHSLRMLLCRHLAALWTANTLALKQNFLAAMIVGSEIPWQTAPSPRRAPSAAPRLKHI